MTKKFPAPLVTSENLSGADADPLLSAGNTPARVGRYILAGELGRGSMGVVYLGTDPYIERKVALKISNPPADMDKTNISAYHLGFFREARSAGRLNHPNIVAIYDADMYQRACYIAMEYVAGPTLKKFCTPSALMPVNKVIDLVFNVCKALDYAHNLGIIHWDIKPENILLTPDGAAKVTDFGIARMKHETLPAMEECFGDITGTFRYMSPQHILEPRKVDSRNDIFSLGCVLYELLTGAKAFQGDNAYAIMYQVTHKMPASILQIRPELPALLEKITDKALQKDPALRYQTCMDFAYDLAVAARHYNLSAKEPGGLNVLDYVGGIPFFKNFSKREVKAVLSVSSVFKVPAGKIVVTEGAIDDFLFIVLSGTVAVLKQSREIDTIERGHCFGEMAYLSGRPRAATIKTATDCILMKISAALMSRAPRSLQLLFMKSFAETLVDRTHKNHQLILALLEKWE